jgi:hypothetical protein
MTPDEILEILEERLDEEEFPVMFPDLKDALIGYASVWSVDGHQPIRLIYSAKKCVDIFTERDGMTVEEALEWISVNTEGGYLGPQTPIIMYGEEWL